LAAFKNDDTAFLEAGGPVATDKIEAISSDPQICSPKEELELKRLEGEIQRDHDHNKLLFDLRKNYATKLLWLAIVLSALGILFFGIAGFHLWGFTIDEITFRIFFGAIFVEVYAIIRIIVKHLFPSETDITTEIIEKFKRMQEK
jgi:hypothetical protein